MSLDTLFPLIISNTDLSLLSQCELRWFRSRCQHLRKQSFNIDLVAGGSFAAGLEKVRKLYYNERLSEKDAVEQGYEYILESMHDQVTDTDVLKSPERMALALMEYFKQFPLDHEEVLPIMLEDDTHSIEHKWTTELPILHPELKIPLIFKGKLDMLAHQMGRCYGVDEKTCKSFSSNEAELLATSGQFIGYAWLARTKGIKLEAFKIRKIAIQIREIKVKEFEIPITEFMIDKWYDSMIHKINSMVYEYDRWINNRDLQPSLQEYFIPDYGLGCTSYYRPCEFADGCVSKYGEKSIEASFEQIAFDSINRKELPLKEYKELIGVK